MIASNPQIELERYRPIDDRSIYDSQRLTGQYGCPLCNRIFHKLMEVVNHIIQCSYHKSTEITEIWKTEQYENEAVHSYRCKECGVPFVDKKKLTQHLEGAQYCKLIQNTVHDRPEYHCDDEHQKEIDAMEDKRVRKKERNIQCPFCDSKFAQPSELARHVTTMLKKVGNTHIAEGLW